MYLADSTPRLGLETCTLIPWYLDGFSVSHIIFVCVQLVREPVPAAYASLVQPLACGCHDPVHVPALYDHLC